MDDCYSSEGTTKPLLFFLSFSSNLTDESRGAWCLVLVKSIDLFFFSLSLCFIGDNVTHVVVSQVLPDANYFLESCFRCTAALYRPGLSLDRLGLDPV
jgi:hypothetical protein